MITIDLTLDSEDEDVQPRSSAPTRGPSKAGVAPSSLADVTIVDATKAKDTEVTRPLSEKPGGKENTEPQLDDSEELRITKCQVEVWNKDLPHQRHQCGTFKFNPRALPSNAQFCNNCYCYICDKKAKECTNWGDGTRAEHHCNASDKSSFYKNLKRTWGASGSRPEAQAQPRIDAAFAAFAAAQSTRNHHVLTPMGFLNSSDDDDEDDDEDEDEMDYAAAAWRHRNRHITPYRPPAPPKPLEPMPNPADDARMTEFGVVKLHCKAKQGSIQALKQRLMPTGAYLRPYVINSPYHDYYQDKPRGENQIHIGNLLEDIEVVHDPSNSVTSVRTIPLLVVHCDASKKSMVYGIEADKGAKVQEVLDEAHRRFSLFPGGTAHLMVSRGQLRDDGRGLNSLPGWVDVEMHSKAYESGRCLLVYIPYVEPGLDNSSVTIVIRHKFPTHEAMKNPNTTKQKTCFLGTYSIVKTKRCGSAIINAIASSGAKFLLPGQTLNKHALKQVENNMGGVISSNDYERLLWRHRDRPITVVAIWGKRGRNQFARSDWARYDYHQTAVPAVLKASAELDKQASDSKAELDQAMLVIEQLVEAQRCGPPSDKDWREGVYRGSRVPVARLRVELEEKEAGSAEGTAALRVFIWKESIELSTEDMPQGRRMRAGVLFGSPNRPNSGSEHRLSRLLEYLGKRADGVAACEKDFMPWVAASQKSENLTVPGLLKVMESGEMEAATQPPGLAVTLHPYQLQSLGFMQRAERGPGLEFLFWFPVKTVGGDTWWWSPVLKQAQKQAPEDTVAWGGFLCETMGLGKTVEVLALILSDRAHQPPLATTLTTLYPPDHPRRTEATAPALASCAGAPAAPPVAPTAPPTTALTAPPAAVPSPVAAVALPAATLAVQHPTATAAPQAVGQPVNVFNGLVCTNATLVVCAVSLVGQWIAEAKAKAGGSLRIYQYHGQGRIRDPARLAANYDLVVTTYGILGREGVPFGPGDSSSPLQRIQWYRVVFDEGHTVKNPAVGHSKACTALHASRRWCCTGTPIANDIMDLHGQFVALQLAPFNNATFFRRYKNALISQYRDAPPSSLYYALSKVMVRHTKHQKTGGQTVLQLPPLTREAVAVTFSPEEQALYMAEHRSAAEEFEDYRSRGAACVSKHMLKILSFLEPLRRIASGGTLSAGDLPSLKPPNKDLDDNVKAEEDAGAASKEPKALPGVPAAALPGGLCPICHNGLEGPVSTACGHTFCRECLMGALAAAPHCPLCKQAVGEAELHKVRAAAEDTSAQGNMGEVSAGPASMAPSEQAACESKLKALVAELRAMRTKDPAAKALVFSQYSGTLEWLKGRLPAEGFGFRTIEGCMSLKKRSQAIADFQGDPPTTIFLLSMRAGAVGINLTAASHIFLLEPALNPALMEQAIGRAWRMGQQRPVVAKILFVKGSVEENVMNLNARRAGVTNKLPENKQQQSGGNSNAAGEGPAGAAAPQEPAANESAQSELDSNGKVTGCLKSDRQELRMEELEILFTAPNFH